MVCCVTGHRPKGFPFVRDENKDEFQKYISILDKKIGELVDRGYETFITGMADGADIDFAKAVINHKKYDPDIILEAALPYPIQSLKHTTYSSEKNEILLHCDVQHIVSPYYHKGCMHKRNKFMVDRSDLILAIWNEEKHGGTWNTIEYALSKGKKIEYIYLKQIQA